jgi:hypothetical protein
LLVPLQPSSYKKIILREKEYCEGIFRSLPLAYASKGAVLDVQIQFAIFSGFNLLEVNLDMQISAHILCKMYFMNPKKGALRNTQHFIGNNKNGNCAFLKN